LFVEVIISKRQVTGMLGHVLQIVHFRYIKIILRSEAWRSKTKEMYYLLLSLKMISFVLLPQASKPSMNFNISTDLFTLGGML